MASPEGPRRFSDDEMRRILEDATRADAGLTRESAGSGHTLEEIIEAAREVGIDPREVERAAANVTAARAASRSASRVLGLPLVLHEERRIPRHLTDRELARIARRADRVVNRVGMVRQDYNWLDWYDRNGRMYVGVVRSAEETRVRVILDLARELFVGAGLIGVLGAAMVSQMASGPGGVRLAVLVLVAGAAAGLVAAVWRWRTASVREHMRELLDLLEDAAMPGLPPVQLPGSFGSIESPPS